jgi:hypothetical protein
MALAAWSTMSATAEPSVAHPRTSLAVQRDGSLVTISVAGVLDAHGGVELLATLQPELDGATRIDIDLLGVVGSTPEGARSLVRARSLSARLTDGLHFRTGPGAGQEVLLEAFAEVSRGEDEDDEQGEDDGEDAA